MKKFIDKLRKRAERFLVDAKLDLESKEYDVALFHIEQALQLFLKARILSFGVEFPKTHEITKLMQIVKQLGIKDIEKIAKENKEIIELLEYAYISSRYLPFSFSESDAKKALEFVEKVRDILWKK